MEEAVTHEELHVGQRVRVVRRWPWGVATSTGVGFVEWLRGLDEPLDSADASYDALAETLRGEGRIAHRWGGSPGTGVLVRLPRHTTGGRPLQTHFVAPYPSELEEVS